MFGVGLAKIYKSTIAWRWVQIANCCELIVLTSFSGSPNRTVTKLPDCNMQIRVIRKSVDLTGQYLGSTGQYSAFKASVARRRMPTSSVPQEQVTALFGERTKSPDLISPTLE
jgi:hypothetical protein